MGLRWKFPAFTGLPYAYDSLGYCYRPEGMIEEAIRYYEKALQLSPEDANVRKALEELKKKRGGR